MRIAVVHSFYRSTEPSGENAVVLAQVNALRHAGNEVQLVSRSTDDESRSRFYRLSAAAAAAGVHGPSPKPELDKFQPEVIHVHNLFPNFGTKWARELSVPIVWTAHNFRAFCSSGTLFRDGHSCIECLSEGSQQALIHSCYRDSLFATAPLAWATRGKGRMNAVLDSCSRVITLNGHATSIFSSILGRDRIIEIPNFVEQIAAEESRSGATDRKGFAYLGRLTSEKGIEWLIQNWPPGQPLTVAGSGPLEQMVQDAARQMPDINFRGQVDRAEAYSLIAQASAVVLPSLWSEGIPTVALEAYSTGTPIVISECVGAADRLTSDRAGVKFDPARGRDGLVAALDEVQSDADSRSNAALNQYYKYYSRSTWVDEIMSLYRTVIEETCV